MIIKNLFLKLADWLVKRKQPESQQQNNVIIVNNGNIEIHNDKR